MSFASGFYTLRVELSDPENARYEKLHVKTPRHPSESSEHLAARFLAYAHAYSKGLEFSGGLFEPSDPSIFKKDITGELLTWVYVGVPPKKSHETVLRTKAPIMKRIYLYSEAQKESYRHQLASFKTHRKNDIETYFIEPEKLSYLSECEKTSSEWKMTLVDEHVFITCGEFDVDVEVAKFDVDIFGSEAINY